MLRSAVDNGYLDVVARLQSHPEVDIDDVDSRGATLLSHLAQSGQGEQVRVLLSLGADPTIADNYGRHPLHWASGTWHPCVGG